MFEGFYNIWAWSPSWSCDVDAANKLSLALIMEAPHETWLPRSVNLTGKQANAGHKKTTVNKLGIKPSMPKKR